MDTLFIIFIIALVFCIIYMAFNNSKKNQNELKLQYLAGYPGIKGPKSVRIKEVDNYLEFEGLRIPKNDITEIKLVPRSVVGSAAAGAALGAIVAGPIGALVGGAAAAGSQGAGNVINLSYSKSGINYELFFADADIINKYPRFQMMIK